MKKETDSVIKSLVFEQRAMTSIVTYCRVSDGVLLGRA
jgi:hypothetical protein